MPWRWFTTTPSGACSSGGWRTSAVLPAHPYDDVGDERMALGMSLGRDGEKATRGNPPTPGPRAAARAEKAPAEPIRQTVTVRVDPERAVLAWHPPHSVLMAWRPHSEPEPPTEVEVTFTPREGGTLVELEHRGWERLSEDFRQRLYETYARGWITTLGCFAVAAH